MYPLSSPRFSRSGVVACLLIALSAMGRIACTAATALPPSPNDWRAYLGDNTRTHYSPLAQINRANAAQLEQVWTYRDAAASDAPSSLWRSQPLIIDGVLYAVTPAQTLVALDASTGREHWRFAAPGNDAKAEARDSALGVTYWSDGTDRRLFFVSDDQLYAIDAKSGRPVATFGTAGHVIVGRPGTDGSSGAARAPVTVINEWVIAACEPRPGGTATTLRAFDVRTGKQHWSSDVAIHPDGVLAADEARGLIYASTSGGSLVCIDGSNGSRVWEQALDKTLSVSPTPVLFTLHLSGHGTPAVTLTTRKGRVLVWERTTGEPLLSGAAIEVIPEDEARNAAGVPAIDPHNGLYLAGRRRPLAGIDLGSHHVRWRAALTPADGGDPIVTGGGLVFRAAGEAVHAFDRYDGTMVWTAPLPQPATTTPATYRVQDRQFLVVPHGDALIAYALPATVIARPAAEARPSSRFDEEIGTLEAQLGQTPPAPGGIVFYGSSTLRLWNTKSAFPTLPITNLGFGGSQITDLTHFAERLLPPLQPRLVVFYSGNNDINANFTLEEVVGRYRTFAAWMTRHLPECEVLVLSNLPTARRWVIWPDLYDLNARLAAEIAQHPRHHYIDITPVTLDPDGRLRVDRISADNLHLGAAGYAALREAVAPTLEQIWARIDTRTGWFDSRPTPTSEPGEISFVRHEITSPPAR